MKSDESLPTHNKPAGNRDETSAESDSGSNSSNNIDSSISRIIDDEILRARIRRLANEQPPTSAWQRFSANPLVPIILGFVLSGLLGGFITNYFTLRQKEFEIQRVEAQRTSEQMREDQRLESDRIREVWEKIYETEPKTDRLVERISMTPGSLADEKQNDVKRVNELLLEEESVIRKNIFSIRPEISNKIREYDNINREYYTYKILGAAEQYLSEALKKREQAKQSILELGRTMRLERETPPGKAPEQAR